MIWQTVFASSQGCVFWEGKCVQDSQEFNVVITGSVVARLHDEEGSAIFEEHLRGLSLTGMGQDALEEVLAAEVPEMRDWAVGEALAEAVLEAEYNVVFPWNTERDKRTPFASLPGADIVGFQQDGNSYRLALGEVKSSSDETSPPQVMYGRSGMTHQIDELATNLSKIFQLIKWLVIRVKNTTYENAFNEACERYLNSGRSDLALFGVLVRDQEPRESDLESRARTLANSLQDPTHCRLIALYLPWPIAQLPEAINQGDTP